MVMPGGVEEAKTYWVLEAQKLGAGAFVRKPITRQVIVAAVRTKLDRKVRRL